MIVTCSECDTQFKLDDSKVSGNGLNVRCSVCKHAFFVEARGSEDGYEADDSAAAFDWVAGAAIEAAFSDQPRPTPEATQDLADDEGEISPTDGPSHSDGVGEADESSENESDWEFSLDESSEADASPVKAPKRKAASGTTSAAEHAVAELLGPAPPPRVQDASEDEGFAAAEEGLNEPDEGFNEPEDGRNEQEDNLNEPEGGLGDPDDWDFFGNEGGFSTWISSRS